MTVSTRAGSFRVYLLALVPSAASGRLQLVPFPGEACPVDFAGRGSRQAITQFDDVGQHVARQPPPAVIQHVLAGEIAAAVPGADPPTAPPHPPPPPPPPPPLSATRLPIPRVL